MLYLQENSAKLLCTQISFLQTQVRYLPRRIVKKLIPKGDTICGGPSKINPFEKYAYLFKKNNVDKDQYYPLHYGTVRFDNDNIIEFGTNCKNIYTKGESFSSNNDNQVIQKVHKKHEKNGKQKSSIDKIMPLCSDQEKTIKHQNANNFNIPEYHQRFNTDNATGNFEVVQRDVQCLTESKNYIVNDNYFDDKYFSSVIDDSSNIEANGNHSKRFQSSAEFKNNVDDNYFDEQYFSSVNGESSGVITANANQILVTTVGQEAMSDMRISYSNANEIENFENDKLSNLNNNHLGDSTHRVTENDQEVKMGKTYAVNLERNANLHGKQKNTDLFNSEEKNVAAAGRKITSDNRIVYSDANKIEKIENNKFLNLNNNHLRHSTKRNITVHNENERRLEFKNLDEVKMEKKSKAKLERKASNCSNHANKHNLESDDLVPDKEKNETSELLFEKDEYKNCSSNSEGKMNIGSKFCTGEDIIKRLRSGNVKELEETFPEENFVALKGHSYYDTKGYRVYTFAVPQFHNYAKQEIFSVLKNNILYNKDGLLAINKPYGLVCQSGPCMEEDSKLNILNYLEMLSKHLKLDSIIPVHRLDRDTTGVFLFALNEVTAKKLKDLFASSQLLKIYWALCKGIPSLPEAKIEIPIMEGKIGNKYRMVLNPIDRPKDMPKDYTTVSKCFSAITEYKLLSCSDVSCASLLEVHPLTGVKHQIRVHLGFGLKCPILGDHKYSHLKKLAPQTLNDSMLKMLKVRQQKVRTIPMHLHARQIVLPEFQEGKNVLITAPLPKFFKNTLKHLKLFKD